MANGVGKHLCLAFTVGPGVLLRTQHNGLTAVGTVDTVDHSVEPFHLLKLLGSDVKQVVLHGIWIAYAHHYHSRLLILVALTVYLAKQLPGGLDNGDRRIGRGDEAAVEIVPVLSQVFAKGVGVDKHSHHRAYRVLRAQLLGTSGGIVAYVGAQCGVVAYHTVETAACADALFLRHLFVGHAVHAVEFLPSAVDDDIVECHPHPVAMATGEVESRFHPVGCKFGGITPSHSPDIVDGKEFQRLLSFLVRVYHATMIIS